MPKLNLEAKNETQKIIKDYLEKTSATFLPTKSTTASASKRTGKRSSTKRLLRSVWNLL